MLQPLSTNVYRMFRCLVRSLSSAAPAWHLLLFAMRWAVPGIGNTAHLLVVGAHMNVLSAVHVPQVMFTSCRVGEAARDIDLKYGLRTRVRHAREDFVRMRPYWVKRFKAFRNSSIGQTVVWGLFVWAILSGLFFRLITFMLYGWFVIPLIVLPITRLVTGKQGPAGQRQRQQQRKAQDPFSRSQKPQSQSSQYDGPVIDAQWWSVDSGDGKRR